LKEWFVLEVRTPEAVLETAGTNGTNVTATMSPDGAPALVKALTSVAGNQVVELRVQVFGDLVGPTGERLSLSEVSWEGKGEDFQADGSPPWGTGSCPLDGPRFPRRLGQILLPQTEDTGVKYTQRIVYSLMAI
jgi:hypothetical protein